MSRRPRSAWRWLPPFDLPEDIAREIPPECLDAIRKEIGWQLAFPADCYGTKEIKNGRNQLCGHVQKVLDGLDSMYPELEGAAKTEAMIHGFDWHKTRSAAVDSLSDLLAFLRSAEVGGKPGAPKQPRSGIQAVLMAAGVSKARAARLAECIENHIEAGQLDKKMSN